MEPSTRTPEGEPNRCPVCGKDLRIEPSRPPGDAPCPHCGHLLWFPSSRATGHGGECETETKGGIRGIVAEIARLSRADVDIPRQEYFGVLIPGLVRMLAARAGYLWMPVKDTWGVQFQTGGPRRAADKWVPAQERREVLSRVLSSGQPVIERIEAKPSEQEKNEETCACLLLAVPIKRQAEIRAVIEVVQRPGAGPAAERGYLRFLQQMGELASTSAAIVGPGASPDDK